MTHGVATHKRRRRARWLVLAVALAIGGTACIVAGLLRPAGDTVLVDHRVAAPAGPEAVATTPVTSPSPRVAPVHLSIPAIHVSKRLLRLGLMPDRTVAVPAPANAAFPGWFKLGAVPGQVGSAVVLGHVDSLTGPAVFYALSYLKRGDHVNVRLENGHVVHFVVRRVATYLNKDFPAHEVYASHGYPALNLITCGGAYEREHGGYQSNIVVYTRLAHPAARAASS